MVYLILCLQDVYPHLIYISLMIILRFQISKTAQRERIFSTFTPSIEMSVAPHSSLRTEFNQSKMITHASAYCASPLVLRQTSKKRHRSICRCQQSGSSSRQPALSRRAMLIGLAGFMVAPAISSAEEERPTEKPLTGFVTKSGLKYFDFSRGEGPSPKWGDLVNIHYTAYTISSDAQSLIKQDSSYDYGDEGYLLHHGNGEQILGLEEAIHSMTVGSRRRCIIPKELAYIKQGLGPVPLPHGTRKRFSEALTQGDGTVVFDIELRRVMADPDDRGYYEDLVPTDEEIMRTFKEQQGNYADA